MKWVLRTLTYQNVLDAIEARIAQDNPAPALRCGLTLIIELNSWPIQISPRRRGRVNATSELVAHPNYMVILEKDARTGTALNVVHAHQKWPA